MNNLLELCRPESAQKKLLDIIGRSNLNPSIIPIPIKKYTMDNNQIIMSKTCKGNMISTQGEITLIYSKIHGCINSGYIRVRQLMGFNFADILGRRSYGSDFRITKRENKNSNKNTKEGYVYCITSDFINFVKIGYCTTSINLLRLRYVTYYTKHIRLFYVKTINPRLLEKKCHQEFKTLKISNELFAKTHWNDYVEFLKNNVKDQ
jgi:hypothetical protein